MSENENENKASEEKEEQKDEGTESKEKKKSKFTFKCTRCDECCLSRGPIPITFWDLELWARNGVVANFLPYLDLYTKPNGSMDLVLKPIAPKKEGEEEQQQSPFDSTPMEELLEEKCPLYNKEEGKCLVYENRPLSCRTYPLEYDGTHYSIVDVECPGIGEEGMTKEELKEMREIAQRMNYELTRIRIALPVLNQIISSNFMKELMKQQMEAMNQMSDEDKEKLNEIMSKGQPNVPQE